MHVIYPSSRTRLKVCGITRAEDALVASRLGVDALGFVFYEKSPRYISPERAAAIIRQIPPFVSAVGLFVNPSQAEIDAVLAQCPLGVIQLHGDETPEFCQAQARRVIKAVAIRTADDVGRVAQFSCPVLLDAKAPSGVYGGTGRCFDWSLLEGLRHRYPLILAGGLNADNIVQALQIRPWFAVDVSSGVELSPGIKDEEKIKALVKLVNAWPHVQAADEEVKS